MLLGWQSWHFLGASLQGQGPRGPPSCPTPGPFGLERECSCDPVSSWHSSHPSHPSADLETWKVRSGPGPLWSTLTLPPSFCLCPFIYMIVYKCTPGTVETLPIGLKFFLTSTKAPKRLPLLSVQLVFFQLFSSLRAGFFNIGTADIWGWKFCYGNCPELCWMFSLMPGLCLLGASPTSCWS